MSIVGQNIQKTYSILQSAPTEQLISLLQNPNPGSAPAFLVAAELGRRERVKQAMQPSPSPQPTVAQQLVQQASSPVPPQGLGAPPPSIAMSAPPASPPIDRGVGSLPYDANYADGGIVSFSNRGYVEGEEQGEEDTPWWKLFTDVPEATPAFTELRPPSPKKEKVDSKEATLDKISDFFVFPKDESAKDYSGYKISETEPPRRAVGLGAIAPTKIEEVKYPDKMEMPEKWKGYGAYAQDVADAKREMGVDPDVYKKLLEKGEGRKAEAEKARKQQGWLDLAGGFLKMAQTPGSFGTALATGAGEALKGYGETAKEYRKEVKDIEDYNDRLALAEYAEKSGDARGAIAQKQKAEADFRDAKNKETEMRFRVDVANTEARNAAKLSDRELAARYALAEFQVNAQYDIANLKYKGVLSDYQTKLAGKIATLVAGKGPSPDIQTKLVLEEAQKILASMQNPNSEIAKEYAKQGTNIADVSEDELRQMAFKKAEEIVLPVYDSVMKSGATSRMALFKDFGIGSLLDDVSNLNIMTENEYEDTL